jgi:undecaprenyl-diphosphatase
VIVAEKLMGLNPSAPEMTFFLVMLHTGTMFAVLVYFGSRWKALLSPRFIRRIILATVCTGFVGLGLKKVIEKSMQVGGVDRAEIEMLFSNLPLIALALLGAGVLIILAGLREAKAQSPELTHKRSAWIGVIQGLCLPFRGFSRSGATISTAMLGGLDRRLSEEFSFALAVVLTPPVVALELHRLHKAAGGFHPGSLTPALAGMALAFVAGLGALKWLSSWLENGRWRYFGYYCVAASLVVGAMAALGY